MTQPHFSLRRRALIASATATAATLVAGFPPMADAANLGNLVYGQGSIDPIFTVGYIALKQGYFEQGGLSVKYLNTQSGPRTNQLLAAGQILVGATAATAAPALTLAGKPATLIFGFDRRMTYANVLVRKSDHDSGRFRSIKDLAGQTIGATQPGSVTWLMAKYLTQKAGIAGHVDIRPLGDLSTMLGALKTGAVAATMATASMMEQAIAEGWGVAIFDGTQTEVWNELMGGDIPGIAAYVLQETIERQPKLVQAFVDAMVKAQNFINTHDAEQNTDAAYKGYMDALPYRSVLDAVRLYKETVWLPDNLITQDAYHRMTEIMGDGRQFSNAEIAQVPYSRCVDMSFVRKARGLTT
jgi:NitT/TauT family transport system substrate-binding protein